MGQWGYKVVGLNRDEENEELLKSIGEKEGELVAVTDTYDQDGMKNG
jgi:hypothetical protein